MTVAVDGRMIWRTWLRPYSKTSTFIMINKHFVLAALFCFSVSTLLAQEYGLQLYSLREQFKKDVPGTLVKIKQWDIKEVEGGGSYGLPLDDYKKLLAQNNLKMVSVGADYQTLKDDPKSAISAAKEFGAKFVVCYWLPHEGDNFDITNIKEAVAVFNSAGKILKDQGISLCYHPHGYEFRPYENGTLFDYLVKNTDPKYFNFEMDVFWIKHPGQDPVALLKKYPDRFLLMHLKDRKPGTEGNQNGHADTETNVVLGTGDVGIAEIIKEARKLGVKHYFIEDESSRCEEQIPLSLKFLHSLKKK
jgi:sugar phosphate isomerase/epimerase